MERLTDKKEADAQRKAYEKRLKNGYPRNIPEERFLKLAAYEDVMSLERAKELAQAEKDGRLVVLREMRTEGATSYCPKNCPNKDCVGGQCLVNHGTKPRRR